MADKNKAEVKDHHKKSSLCASRPKYREARWGRAVKVYTINLESKFLLVQGVPALGVTKDLLETFAIYGIIDEYRIMDDYPSEDFTKVYWIKFKHIMAARKAKRKLDNRSFFGGILHVSYAAEFESVEETREKLMDRKRIVERKINYDQKQSNKEQKSHDEQPSSATCSRINITENVIPDHQIMRSSSSAHTPIIVHENEPTQLQDNIAGEFTYNLFPPKLPPLTVPTYPSQVPTISTSLNTSYPPFHLTSNNQVETTHTIDQPRSVSDCNQTSSGYNSNVSFPARPSRERKEVSSGPAGDRPESPLESLTGDRSLDQTVLSIREKLKKINKRPSTETSSDKKKKERKRI